MPRKKRIQKLPAPTSAPRVESGAVQFGDDWPGLFLRGDHCIALLADIRRFAKEIGSDRLIMLPIPTGAKIALLTRLIEEEVLVPHSEGKP